MSACEVLVKSGRFVPSKPSDLLANGYRELKEDKVHIEGLSLYFFKLIVGTPLFQLRGK